MITVICGTNRKGSKSHLIAKHCVEQLKALTEQSVQYINLEELDLTAMNAEMYSPAGQSSQVQKWQDASMIPAEKYLFIIAEYNGSYPGALKLFIDAASIREYAGTFKGKKAGMIGVSAGRAGSLRSMDQFATVLNHVGSITFPAKLPISGIDGVLNAEGAVSDEGTSKAIESHLQAFLQF